MRAVATAALFLLLGCSRLQQRHESVNATQETKWDNRTSNVEEKQQQTETETRQIVKRTTRRVIKKPDGTVSDTTVVEEAATDQRARSDSAETASRSKLRTGETFENVRAASSSVNESKPSGWQLPWWLWAIAILVMLSAVLRIAWEHGWRPWKRGAP